MTSFSDEQIQKALSPFTFTIHTHNSHDLNPIRELRQEQPPPTAAAHPLLLIVEHRRCSRRPLYRRTLLILSSRLFSLRPLLILSTHLYGKHSSAPPLLVDATSVDHPTHIPLSPVCLLRLCRWLAPKSPLCLPLRSPRRVSLHASSMSSAERGK
ncbi:uncharacterized protein LOC130946025 [Arachis stenosperma]|uniref:uncharacterized protein LOC130946025 n=1 Tax=Arachis stenosperma TaxID=217475 RepID=UPI0025AD1080|nr:uncharacterized protein LOC130946025 [Arachis stenosperma]